MSAKPPAKSGHGARDPGHESRRLTVFLTGNELGALKPCGCSGGQLGGFDRRWAVLNSVPASKRMIVDTGRFVEGDSEQERIKFSIIIEAFSLLGYDVVNLTEKDIEMARNLGLLESISAAFNVISAGRAPDVNVPARFTKQLSLNNRLVIVNVASVDVQNGRTEALRELFTSPTAAKILPATVNVLVLNQRDTAVINSISKMGIVDCVVVPPESDEPVVIGDPNKGVLLGSPHGLVVSAGRYGKYVGRLQIKAGDAEDKLRLSFRAIPVTEGLDRESSLIGLYKDYQQWVKDDGLLEKHLRLPLPDALKYVGSESCKVCHAYEYKKWSSTGHAQAYSTLVKDGSQYDPECVVCHVIGMEYESGFVSEQIRGHLKDVGCENCHGPGSKHIEDPPKEKTSMPMSDCSDCHTPETSGDYAADEGGYLEKIMHWGEPNAAGNVK